MKDENILTEKERKFSLGCLAVLIILMIVQAFIAFFVWKLPLVWVLSPFWIPSAAFGIIFILFFLRKNAK